MVTPDSSARLSLAKACYKARYEAALAAVALFLSTAPAQAADCAEWMTNLVAARNAALVEVSKSKNPLNGLLIGDVPIFCTNAAKLHSAEAALVGFMVKNKDHCSFPDSAISQLKKTMENNQGFANGYCR